MHGYDAQEDKPRHARTVLVGGVEELGGDEAVGAHRLRLHLVQARRQPDCGLVVSMCWYVCMSK